MLQIRDKHNHYSVERVTARGCIVSVDVLSVDVLYLYLICRCICIVSVDVSPDVSPDADTSTQETPQQHSRPLQVGPPPGVFVYMSVHRVRRAALGKHHDTM